MDNDANRRQLAVILVHLDGEGLFLTGPETVSGELLVRQHIAALAVLEDELEEEQVPGDARYLAFERSGSMSRSAVLSFVRADIYEALSRRMTVGMTLGVCRLSKLYAYNGLLFSSSTRSRISRRRSCASMPRARSPIRSC